MPADADQIDFRPVLERDYALLRDWLERPHWREWWGEPEQELGYIRDMVEGRDTTRPFIILLEGQPVGYIQSWSVGDHQTKEWTREHPWLTELPAQAVGVDISLGDARRLSKGIGTAALQAFIARLGAEGFTAIVIDPDPGNRRAIRAYEKAGFRPIPDLVGRTGDCLLMQYCPDTDTRPDS